MTIEQKTLFIIGKAIEANPEIVEVDMTGCKNHGGLMRNYSEGCTCSKRERPITLEDILMAIDIRKPTIEITDPESVDYGDIVDITEEEMGKIMLAWHLGKPFTSQSEELKNFVYEILKDG